MKSRLFMCIAAITLFATLAMPLQFGAQNSQEHNHHKHVRYSIQDLGTLGGTFSCRVITINTLFCG
jgi:hypothetical protein